MNSAKLRAISLSQASLSGILRQKLPMNGMSSAASVEKAKEKLGSIMSVYEEYTGIAEVTAAQHRVLECEESFLRAQAQRRDHQLHINHVQAKLKDLHAEIAKTSRGEDRYLSLVTEEHRVLRDESRLTGEYRVLEKAEQELFQALSASVRFSHEKERAQAEKTKYWSIIGSAVGAAIGIVGTSVNNWLRMRELRGIASSSAELPQRLQGELAALTASVEVQRAELSRAIHTVQEQFGTLPVASVSGGAGLQVALGEQFADEVAAQLRRLEQQQAGLRQELAGRWPPAAAAAASGGADPEQLQMLLAEHEQRVERRLIRASASLATVGVLCGALLAAALSRAMGGH